MLAFLFFFVLVLFTVFEHVPGVPAFFDSVVSSDIFQSIATSLRSISSSSTLEQGPWDSSQSRNVSIKNVLYRTENKQQYTEIPAFLDSENCLSLQEQCV